MTTKTNKIFSILLYFAFTGVIFFIMMFFFSNCGLKKSKEEIGPLKTVMGIFERGVVNQDKAVLDSVYSKKDINSDSLIQAVIGQFLALKTAEGIEDLHFARRRFSFIEEKDSAQVDLILGGEKLKEEKVLKVFLKKRWGDWKIVAQSME